MNITVLEHPRIPSEKYFNDIANTPLCACLMAGYATAALREAGMGVCLLDARLWEFDETAGEIVRQQPDLLCIHAVYFWEHTPKLFDCIREMRQLGFSGHINLFGFFPTLAWEAVLTSARGVDSITVGECEITLPELAKKLQTEAEWEIIPGIACCRGEAVRPAAHRPPLRDPDQFPFPVRHMLDGETESVLASRGCYNHCRFCPIPEFDKGGAKWRGRAPEEIVREIRELKEKGVEDIYFVDPNFIGPGRRGRRRALALTRLMEPLGITFGMETRANDLDLELMEQLKSSGLQSLLIGIESGSPDILGELNKGASIRSGEAAIAHCRAVGIEPEIGFLMFVPDSTLSDLAANLAFLKRNGLLDRLDRTANFLCHRQIVFMGTSGYQRFEAQGRITEKGCFGFQAEIRYLDDRVYWLAQVMVHACLMVLKQTGLPESPLYWEKHTDWHAARGLNDYLVGLFERLLNRASEDKTLPLPATVQQSVETEIAYHVSGLEQTQSELPD